MGDIKNEEVDAPKKAKAFTIKYKRPRGLRACAVCRSRKVRCDAEMHIPCTNCITFGCDCVLPEAKRRGNTKRREIERAVSPVPLVPQAPLIPAKFSLPLLDHLATNNEAIVNISQVHVTPSLSLDYQTIPTPPAKRKFSDDTPPPIGGTYRGKTALTFLGSTLVGAVARRPGENHVELTDDVLIEPTLLALSLDLVELEILKLRGAFMLPLRELAADLIESYFEHVHPLMPVINRTEFMRKFNDPDDQPSLMLMHAVLLLGTRVSSNPAVLDDKGLNDLVLLTLFRRAKALYETNYESDTVPTIQTLILIALYWEGPEDVTKNSFYWTRVAIGLAQGFGFHRDVLQNNHLLPSEKRIWRRIWWCLFEKDRNVAIAFGRPLVIDLNDCDVPMLTLEDFKEDEEDGMPSPYPVNETHALYFIHLVKLAEITGIIIKHQYLVKLELLKRKNKFSIIQHCDMLMGIWFTNLPKQLVFNLNDPQSQLFWCCLLNAQYYNRLFLIHRLNLVRMLKLLLSNPNNYKYPSWGISFQAARMISIVSKILLDLDQIRYVPVMFIYVAFSALIMLIYHVDSSNNVIALTALDSLYVSRAVLQELAKYWPIARVLMNLFDKYGNDKIKRRRLIDHSIKRELLADVQAGPDEPEDPHLAPTLISPHLVNLGVSPTGNTYDNPYKPVMFESANSETISNHNHQEVPKKSPALLTQLFPDISLVTETVPSNPNFFENFDPTQLFPDIRTSVPPSRVHSPGNDDGVMGSNVYTDLMNSQQTQAEAAVPNFVDLLYIGMNMQAGLTEAGTLDEMASLFNFQY